MVVINKLQSHRMQVNSDSSTKFQPNTSMMLVFSVSPLLSLFAFAIA